MSKNLENEYKKLSAQEVKDFDAESLWARIESALPEKNVDGTVTEEMTTETALRRETVELEAVEVETMDTMLSTRNVEEKIAETALQEESTKMAAENSTASETTQAPVISMEQKRKWYQNKKLYAYVGTVAAACLLGVILLQGVFPAQDSLGTTNSAYFAPADHANSFKDYENLAVEECEEEGCEEAPSTITTEGTGLGENPHLNGLQGASSAEVDEQPCKEEMAPEAEQLRYTDLVILPLEWVDDYLKCVVMSGCEELPEGEVILLPTDDGCELVIGEEYPCSLRYLGMQENLPVFVID